MIMAQLPPNSAETLELLNRVRTGEDSASEELFTRYRDYLRGFIALRLDPQLRRRVDPSDVVQEAQMEAARRLQNYLKDEPLPFRLWLRQIALDRLLNLRRQHVATSRRAIGREQALPEQSSVVLARQLLASGSTPSQRLSRRELARRLAHAVSQLAEADREILLLRNFEGLSNQEVGLLLGIDPATASQRHGRAMLRLYKILVAGGLTESQL
jgi:RNA polymerase sigma-70 factor (ECF subfamily)